MLLTLRLAQKKVEAVLFQCAYTSWPSVDSITLVIVLVIWDCRLAPLSSRNGIEDSAHYGGILRIIVDTDIQSYQLDSLLIVNLL